MCYLTEDRALAYISDCFCSCLNVVRKKKRTRAPIFTEDTYSNGNLTFSCLGCNEILVPSFPVAKMALDDFSVPLFFLNTENIKIERMENNGVGRVF